MVTITYTNYGQNYNSRVTVRCIDNRTQHVHPVRYVASPSNKTALPLLPPTSSPTFSAPKPDPPTHPRQHTQVRRPPHHGPKWTLPLAGGSGLTPRWELGEARTVSTWAAAR
ncbi:hypothetical protein ACOMHN_023597 [Nucella lapillus]